MAAYALNDEQREAVLHKDGPLLVVAGAGTGKTSVIVNRVLHLLGSGVEQRQILAVTFTEKAAYEMLDRITSELKDSYRHELAIMTFNSFGAMLLGTYGVEIGIGTRFRLVGEQGKLLLLREHFDELGLDYFAPVSDPAGQLAPLAEYFSTLKQQLVDPESYLAFAASLPASDEAERIEKQRHTELARAFLAYQKICRRRNVIDYDDQIYLAVQLLEKRPNVRKTLQDTYHHLLVDEFQDTNPMQSRLVELLYRDGPGRSLVVVGDDDQSIYGWRGATLRNILDFTEIHPDTKVVTLIRNYRSTQQILDAAYRLIGHNNPERLESMQGIDKRLLADAGEGEAPLQRAFPDLESEIAWVAEDIKRKLADGTEPGEIAVLARRGRGGVEKVHDLFEAYGVDHHTVGISSSLYDSPAVQTMIQALRCAVDPADNMPLYHTLGGSLFQIDAAMLGRLSAIARRRHETLESVIVPDESETLDKALDMIREWQKDAGGSTVGRLAYRIMTETGLKDRILEEAERSEQGQLAAQSLFQWFKTLKEFERNSEVATALSYLSAYETLQADGEMVSEDAEPFDRTKPVVMTVHKSKGLEWDHVYVIDCTEGSLPTVRRGSSLAVPEAFAHLSSADDHYSEERRLMYVAMTRARRSLTLSYSMTHNGTTSRKPSRFISEIFERPLPCEPSSTQPPLFAEDAEPTATVQLPTNLYNGSELVLSVTQASDYLRCPLDFYYRHVIGLPPVPSPHAAVGTLFHDLIQRINISLMESTAPPSKESLLNELQEGWPKEDYLTKQQRERALKKGIAAFETLYDRLVQEGAPIAAESKFRVKVPGAPLVLTGRIDAVYARDGGIEIRDYKTSVVRDAAAAKQRTTASKQLELYALAYRLQHDELPKSVSLDFVQSGLIGTVRKQAKTIDNLETKLHTVAHDILNGQYPPGYDHAHCRHP